MSIYKKLPRRVRIVIASAFGWCVLMPTLVAKGIIRGAISGWRNFIAVYQDRMGHKKGPAHD